MRATRPGGALLTAALSGALAGACVQPARAQESVRDALERLRFPELEFTPPEVQLHRLGRGIEVYLLEDHSLPLVDVMARFRGGYGYFDRAYYAAGTALPGLLRSGGTEALSPDSVDALAERMALQTTFGGSGESVLASLNALTEHLEAGLALWASMLVSPRFDSARVELWRATELESVRRRRDDPGRLVSSEFNRLMFGDHPVGWELSAEDLGPERFSRASLEWVHRRVVCPENAVLGVAGDVTWTRIQPLLEALLADWPSCAEPLPAFPAARIRAEPGIFLIPRTLPETAVVLGLGTDLRRTDSSDYFASRIGNALLGGGGLTSRLATRVRTERGYAYTVSSVWTAPEAYGGILGATTRTAPGSTVAALRLIEEVMLGMTRSAPSPDEVRSAVDEAVNGFAFNFTSAARIVSRRLGWEQAGLPADWLERYLAGLRAVRPDDVLRAFRRYLDPDRLVIVVVGDPDAFGEPLEALGPVTVLDPGRSSVPGPSGSPRSRR